MEESEEGMNNEGGKEKTWKRGKAKTEQRKQGWPIKWKRAIPQRKNSQARFARFRDFFNGFSFSTLSVISLFPFVQFDPSSLPWFFLSLFIVHPFLPSLPWFFSSVVIVHPFLPSSFLPSLPWFCLYFFIVYLSLL